MAAETRSLHRKLAQIMYEAERIPKRGRAPKEMGGYPFVQVGDAADFMRKALAEKVLTMMPTAVQVVGQQDRPTKSGGSMTTVDLVTDWTITDGESGESITIQSFGAGADGGDKYSGKASTSAMKYALLTTFLLSTGEDSELGGDHERGSGKPAPVAAPVEQAADGGLIGTADIGKGDADYNLRQTPDGHAITFRLVSGRKSVKVTAFSPLAEILAGKRSEVIGARVTAWGSLSEESWDKKGDDGKVTTIKYPVLTLTRIKGDGFDLAAPDEPEPTEAPTEPLFDDADAAAVEAAMAKAGR